MTAPTEAMGARGSRPGRRRAVLAAVVLAVVLLVGANAHLVYVAYTSQPDCVPHAREVGIEGAPLRAAASAC